MRDFYNKEKKVVKERRAQDKQEVSAWSTQNDVDKIERLALQQSADMDVKLHERFGEYEEGGEVDGIKPIVTKPNTLYSDTINHERELANSLLNSSESKLAKITECSNRIEYAKEWAVATINEEQNMWSDILYMWENCLKDIKVLS